MGVTPDGNPSQFLQHVEDALRRMGSLPQAPVSAPAHDDSPLSPERYVPGRETVESVSKYSAPVSRETPSGDYSRRYSNTSTTLTQEERQLARRFGLSETEYAVQKLRLPHYKAVRGDEGSR